MGTSAPRVVRDHDVIDVPGTTRALDEAKDALDQALRAALIAAAPRILTAAETGGRAPVIAVTDAMLDPLEGLYEYGTRSARAESERVGVTDRAFALPDRVGYLRGEIAVRLGQLSRRLTARARGGDFGLLTGRAADRAIARAPGVRAIAADLITRAYTGGLADAYEEVQDAFGGWRYSSVLDGATCVVCRPLHGRVYETLAEAYRVLPDFGPNPSCLGGYRCRCRLMPLPPSGELDTLGLPGDPGQDAPAPTPTPAPPGLPPSVTGALSPRAGFLTQEEAAAIAGPAPPSSPTGWLDIADYADSFPAAARERVAVVLERLHENAAVTLPAGGRQIRVTTDLRDLGLGATEVSPQTLGAYMESTHTLWVRKSLLTQGDRFEFTFLHELGHHLDRWGLDPATGGSVTDRGDLLPQVMRDGLTDLVSAESFILTASGVYLDQAYFRYWTRRDEVWARAFSQWAAVRSGVRADRDGQWTEAEWAQGLDDRVTQILGHFGLLDPRTTS